MKDGIIRAYRTAVSTRWISSLTIGLISVGVLAWLFYKGYPFLKNYQWDIQWGYLPLILFIYTVDLLLVVRLWAFILRSLGNQDSFSIHLQRYVISNLARRLPGTIWYVAYRAQAYTSSGLPAITTTAAAAIEAVVSIVSAIIVSAVFAAGILRSQRFGPWITILVLAICLLLIYPGTLRRLLDKFKIPKTNIRYQDLLVWIIGNCMVWALGGILLFFILRMFFPLDFSRMGFVIGCFSFTGLLSRALLFLPTNLGFTEVSLSVLLSTVVSPSIAVISALANRILVTLLEVLWAIAVKAISDRVPGSMINP